MQIKLSCANGVLGTGLEELSIPLRGEDSAHYLKVGRGFGSYCVGNVIGESLVELYALLQKRVYSGLTQGRGSERKVEFNLGAVLSEISVGFGFPILGGTERGVGVHAHVLEEELKGGDFYESAFEISCSPILLKVSKKSGSFVVSITYPGELETLERVLGHTFWVASEVLVARILGGGFCVFQNAAWAGIGAYVGLGGVDGFVTTVGVDSGEREVLGRVLKGGLSQNSVDVEVIVHEEVPSPSICGDSFLVSTIEKVVKGSYTSERVGSGGASGLTYKPEGSDCQIGLEVPTLPVHIKQLFWLDWEIKHNLRVGRTLVLDHTEEFFMDDELYPAFVQRLHELGVNVIVLSGK